jgi:transposase
VDTLGHLLALHVTPADERDRAQAGVLAEQVRQVTGENVELAWVDQGYTGPAAAEAASRHGIQLEVVKLPAARKGFVPLPRRGTLRAILRGAGVAVDRFASPVRRGPNGLFRKPRGPEVHMDGA